jgi:drug/metabolite transporter (DMT)-like permease
MRCGVHAHDFRRLYDRPWLLLSLCALFWAGNAVAGKLAVGEISPMTLTALRWIGACLVLGAIGARRLKGDLAAAKGALPFLLTLGGLGFTGFNAFLYLAAEATDGVNLLIIQGAIPVMILVAAAVFSGQRFRALQLVGVTMTLLGVIVTATDGEPRRLIELAFNHGDVLMLAASFCYALYALLLKRKPVMPALSLFFVLCLGASIAALIGLGVEMWRGKTYAPGPAGWLILAYCILFPSLLSQIFFIRGVELIGAARAALCVNLVPVFGAVLMVAFGEPFLWSHAFALLLVLGGVLLAERYRFQAA